MGTKSLWGVPHCQAGKAVERLACPRGCLGSSGHPRLVPVLPQEKALEEGTVSHAHSPTIPGALCQGPAGLPGEGRQGRQHTHPHPHPCTERCV